MAVMIAAPCHAQVVADELSADVPQGRFTGFDCDVRDLAQVQAVADAARERLGPVDFWINNAGLALGRDFSDLTSNDMRSMLEINVLGTMHGCRAAIEAMATRGGAIYNVYGAGSDGKRVPGMIGYATTKRAVQFFTQSLASELADAGVIVAGLSPGLVMTEGFFREHARTPAETRAQREAFVNIIGDHVETLSNWAARIITTNREQGREFAWLSPAKIRRRQAAPARDILSRYRDADGRLPVPAPEV
jgi:NAD(P)-dependent dehydrogenase (short-subunit alcohol dehydrogenase family)